MNNEIIVSKEQETALKVQNYVQQANTMRIVTSEKAQDASDLISNFNAQIKHLEEVRKEIIAPAKKAYEEYKQKADDHCNPAIKDLTDAKGIFLIKIGEWKKEEEKRIELETLEQEKKERESRQQAERKAEATRAEAEIKAKKLREDAIKAEEDQKKAEEKGDLKGAREAGAKASKAISDALTTEENVEHKVMEIEQNIVSFASTKKTTKVAGVTMRDNWSAQIIGFDDDSAKMVLIKAAAGDRPELAAYLTVNMSTLNQTARAMKKVFNIPGFKPVNKPKAVGARRS